jgi:hypothetical protein
MSMPQGGVSPQPGPDLEHGLGVPCAEAQPDGVPCDEIKPDCTDCERGRASGADVPPDPKQPLESQ